MWLLLQSYKSELCVHDYQSLNFTECAVKHVKDSPLDTLHHA